MPKKLYASAHRIQIAGMLTLEAQLQMQIQAFGPLSGLNAI